MHGETSFRIALVVVILITMAIGIPHRMKAAASGERISYKEEGFLFAATLRIAGLLLWISTLAYLVFPASIAWASIPIPSLLRWIAVAVAIASTTFFYWTLSILGKNLNYYRSHFAEIYFRHLANQHGLDWTVDYRGLRISSGNVGPLSCFTQQKCDRLGIDTLPLRHPLPLTKNDLENAELTIAVKATEHRPLMQAHFPDWEHRIEYWEIHDLDFATADEALPVLRQHVDDLFDRLS